MRVFSDRRELEHVSRQQAASQELSDHVVRCRVLASLDMYVDDRERSLAPWLIKYGFWEAWVTLPICRYVRPGMTVIDAGAHFGYFSLLAADRVGESGRVIAIEPHGRLNPLLRMSVEKNNFIDRVQVDGRALWDSNDEELMLSSPGWLLGSSSLVGHGPPVDGEPTTTQSVTTVTLDTLCDERGIASVDFVKIDCEGSEHRIWQGMQRVWERSADIVICAEYAATPEHERFLDAVRSAGARVQVVGFQGEITEVRPVDLARLRMLWISKPAA